MGYITDLDGRLSVAPPLKAQHAAYLRKFSETRRVARNEQVVATLSDPIREAAGLPVGPEGGYFVAAGGYKGQDDADPSIINFNSPPKHQPGLWCHWVPTADGTGLECDGTKKFYFYVEWLVYLIEVFLRPWGYVVNGDVTWSGEQYPDDGTIHVRSNRVDIEETGQPDEEDEEE